MTTRAFGKSGITEKRRWTSPVLSLLIAFGTAQAQDDSEHIGLLQRLAPDLFGDDGWFDVSKMLDHPFGFFPLVTPITEPAVGYGAAVVPLFINQPDDPHQRPDMWAAGAMMTNNGSKGYFGGYSGYFDEDKWHVIAGAASISINLDFHGLGDLLPSGGDPLQYNLDMVGGMIGVDRKIGSTPWRAGLRYLYGEIDMSLPRLKDLHITEHPDFPQNFGRFDPSDTVSSLQFSLNRDTRDNIFTPTTGTFFEIDLTANLPALGATKDYQLVSMTGIWYHPVIEDCLYFGWRGDIVQSFGDIPFYRRPSVSLRGAPAQRYQGSGIASTEAELRWQVHPRWSVLAFAGAGLTWSDEGFFQQTYTPVTGGAGFRYLVAKRQGIHFGIDIAYGEEGPAFYIQFGSGWFRP